jgi:hypothetical protein
MLEKGCIELGVHSDEGVPTVGRAFPTRREDGNEIEGCLHGTALKWPKENAQCPLSPTIECQGKAEVKRHDVFYCERCKQAETKVLESAA